MKNDRREKGNGILMASRGEKIETEVERENGDSLGFMPAGRRCGPVTQQTLQTSSIVEEERCEEPLVYM